MKGRGTKGARMALALCGFLAAMGVSAAAEGHAEVIPAGEAAPLPGREEAAALPKEGEYLKTATYYSDGWVVNFWNLESDYMEEELAQIAEDGFNSIILAVPWREFQPQTEPVRYSGYAFEKFHRVFEAAEDAGLMVLLRVGYTWDQAGSGDVLERYQKLLYDAGEWDAWIDYVGTVYREASRHANFYGGFLTWEDFWNFTGTAGGMGDTAASRELAEKTGFTGYMQSRYSLDGAGDRYGRRFSSWEEVYLPERDSPAYEDFYRFYDQLLNRILAESQKVFPGLSMEVRADVDPVRDEAGGQSGFAHSATFSCQGADYTALMYSVSMGMESGRSDMRADEALSQTAVILDWVQALNGGKPLYLDQFLFTDNTEGFEGNARLAEEELPAYLEGAGQVLSERTMGYGIWTYRDYGDNMIYNCQFALDKEGWTVSGQTGAVERDGSRQMEMGKNSKISQEVNTEGSGSKGETVKVRFDADSPGGCRLTVKLGQDSRTVAVSGKTGVQLEFPGEALTEFSIFTDDLVYVDNIQVYRHVTEGKLYGMDGEEGSCIQAVRRLNQSL